MEELCGKTTIEILECIKLMLEEEGIQPTISVSGQDHLHDMYNDIVYWKNNESVCRDNAKRVAEFAENFKPGRWSFHGPGDEEKWYGSLIDKPPGQCN